MNDFESQRAAKAARFRQLAEKHANIATGRHFAARERLDVIPLAQPILVGHHSEKRHRKDLTHIDEHFAEAKEHHDKAAYFRRWNDKLRQLEQAREDYEKQRESGQRTITQEQKAQILALAEDFPRLWKDPGTTDRDRKRMARLILADVTLSRDHALITAQIRFKGGATKVLSLPMPPRAWQLRKTKAEIVAEIDRLLDQCTESEIASELNCKGWRSSGNQSFNARMIRSLSASHKLPSRSERLRAKGLLTARQIAELIGSKPLLASRLLAGSRAAERNPVK
jgi:Domain of unknown function (DUF3560)